MEQSQPVQPSQHRLPHHALLSFVTNNVVEVRTRLSGGYAPESESRLLAFSERCRPTSYFICTSKRCILRLIVRHTY